jgi:hypothetical protein
MLGVDRFDMIKGLLQKVLAFEKYLEENTGMNEKVVLLQIAVPTCYVVARVWEGERGREKAGRGPFAHGRARGKGFPS